MARFVIASRVSVCSILAGVLGLFHASLAHADAAVCPQAATLEGLIDCVSRHMPQDRSGGYVPPGVVQQSDVQVVVNKMLQGDCGFPLPASLSANMSLRSFRDASNGRDYCVLIETASTIDSRYVDKGWGSFIVYPAATREISHQAPHPKYAKSATDTEGDAYTEHAAIRVFKATDARSFLMAGARRNANRIRSKCQSDYWMADVAHDTDNLFFPANLALNAFYGSRDWTAIQWHGKAASSCNNDMYISHGFSSSPPKAAKVLKLKKEIDAASPWKTEVPGASSCSLNATTNVEGRMLNGIPPGQVCKTAATAHANKFVHVEQTVDILEDDIDGAAAKWAAAVNAAFPASGTLPPPANLNAVPGDRQALVSWSAVSGAVSYRVKRAVAAGGPFAMVGSPAGTSHTDAGLVNGTTYFYTVSALDANGEGADASPVSVTPAASSVPPAPAGLQAAPGPRRIKLQWQASSGAASYIVKFANTAGGPYATVAMGLAENVYVHRDLSPRKTYYYVVHAAGAAGTSPASNEASATPEPKR